MDSGSAVPMLRPGSKVMVAAKLFTLANCRSAVVLGATTALGGVPGLVAEFMLLRNARCLALESAGRRMAATTAMMATTTMSSISVKARGRIFIGHLGICCRALLSRQVATRHFPRKTGFSVKASVFGWCEMRTKCVGL